MQWREIAQDNFEAATFLYENNYWRSSCTRAYYACFSVITSELIYAGNTPRVNYGTWSHETLLQMVETHLPTTKLNYAMRRLYTLRLESDYSPDITINKEKAFDGLGLMVQIFRRLKLENKQ